MCSERRYEIAEEMHCCRSTTEIKSGALVKRTFPYASFTSSLCHCTNLKTFQQKG